MEDIRFMIKKRHTVRRNSTFIQSTFFRCIIGVYLLVCLFVPYCVEGKWPKNLAIGRPGDHRVPRNAHAVAAPKKVNMQLPKSITPILYQLHMKPRFEDANFTFTGEVNIIVKIIKDTKEITLHARDLKIDDKQTKVNVYDKRAKNPIGIASQVTDTAKQFYIIRLSQDLKIGKKYIVHFKFSGILNDFLQGFYRSSYTVGGKTRLNSLLLLAIVNIIVKIIKDTKEITLHARDLKIDDKQTKVNVYDKRAKNPIGIASQVTDTAKQFYIIRLSQDLKIGKKYIVHFKFSGILNDFLQGFYRSSYTVGGKTRWIAATQFEATDARSAFPCFDEPGFKASFEINIARPKSMTTISNMPIKGTPIPVEGIKDYVWDTYERTLPMSTYLVAFLVTDFKVLRSGSFGVWARAELIEQTRYSLDIGPKILKFYEKFFGIKYPLPKMDLIALPDFAAGAMENWGAIPYRESLMLFKKGLSTRESHQLITTVIAHELGHQWFGNLVTPRWWNDIWLKEGFASYLQYIGMNSVQPDWKVLDQFVVKALQRVFSLDALESSHPVSAIVEDPASIEELFDEISYEKGASVIRMMEHFLTTNVFKQGLTNYLKERSLQNADSNDLWTAMTKQAHKDRVLDPDVTVKKIMDSWVLQTGYPVVTITRNYQTGAAKVDQVRFLIEPSKSSDSKALWWVPLTYTTSVRRDFTSTRPSSWMKAEKSVQLSKIGATATEWVLFNIQETGYYRVNYDLTNWRLITNHLKSDNFKTIVPTNRAQICDDTLNLARAGLLNYTVVLDLYNYLNRETEYIVWKAVLTNAEYLEDLLSGQPIYPKFKAWILTLLKDIYAQVGFQDNPNDPHLKGLTRGLVLSWLCSFDNKDCVDNAARLFKNWQQSSDPDKTNPISPGIRRVVTCTAIRTGNEATWNFVWQRYLKSTIAAEKNSLLATLGCTSNTALLSRLLELAVTENSGIRKQDARIVFDVSATTDARRILTFRFLRTNWGRIKRYFGNALMMLQSIVQSVTDNITTEPEWNELINFEKQHGSELGNSSQILAQSKERAQSNLRWLKSYYSTVSDWLQKNA